MKVAGNGLRKLFAEAWVRDRPWWKTTVHLSEGAKAEEVAPKPDAEVLKPQLDRLHPCQIIKPGGSLPAN